MYIYCMNLSSYVSVFCFLSFIKSCHEHAEKFLKQKNGESQHVIHAMGHCHIDTGIENNILSA